ncbi:MAG TPA: beta-ketoacyl-ACP synthase III [Acidimicrobiales bacterium]|nr:beta-ketoacyl-ACP synthase III [Acidimicrobiales bacterium]
MRRAAITGWGSALPDKVVTNADFEARLDTTDEWITERTGIKERHVGGTTRGLAVEAGRAALERAGLDGAQIDLVIVATTTPDQTLPAVSATVHERLGCRGGAFDVNAACAGFTYSLVLANSMIAAGLGRALIIGSDTLSRITDFEDRATAILFGDGAGAVVVEAGARDDLVLAYDLGADGSAAPLLFADLGGYIEMDGREIFRRAVRAEVRSIGKVFTAAGCRAEDITLFVPHQANVRIIEAVNERVGIPMERTVVVLDRTGNTSAGSIPFGLCTAVDAGRVAEGDLVLLSGFGAGMTWASTIIRWGRRGVA